MPIITDDEFGKITVRRMPGSKSVRIRVAPNGTLRASLPRYTPLLFVKRLVKQSREELRELIKQSMPEAQYHDGAQIGKSHHLVVRDGRIFSVSRHKQQIIVVLPAGKALHDADIQGALRTEVIAALRIEAKSYLPKRLKYIAQQHGFTYESVRFSHASGRWGSCSSKGTISLNIALMKLPFELIDYVLVHELAHTQHMNHGDAFWSLVAQHDPDYVQHRAALKREVPAI